jgi:hypothetical protein
MELHASRPLHTSLSSHEVPAATGACDTPAVASQESVVQGLPSSMTGAVPGKQAPVALQTSRPSHSVALSQCVPAGATVWLTPVFGSQASMVQGLPSSSTGAFAATHAPLALQLSWPLQALPSEQLVPTLTGT